MNRRAQSFMENSSNQALSPKPLNIVAPILFKAVYLSVLPNGFPCLLPDPNMVMNLALPTTSALLRVLLWILPRVLVPMNEAATPYSDSPLLLLLLCMCIMSGPGVPRVEL